MNFQKVQKKNRKAISPVLATVILIAITLIAAIAIAGFVFGLFGSFTSSANVSAAVTACGSAAGTSGHAMCTLTLTNSGTSNVQVNACSIQDQGTAKAGTWAYLGTATNVPAGASVSGTCTLAAVGNSAAGSQAVGSLAMSNGASVPFSGVWSS